MVSLSRVRGCGLLPKSSGDKADGPRPDKSSPRRKSLLAHSRVSRSPLAAQAQRKTQVPTALGERVR